MRKTFAVGVFTLLLGAAQAAMAAQVTFVMNGGERHTGELFYTRGTEVGLVINGQKRTFPVRDIAVMLYGPGDPSNNEINQLPTSDSPPELERHTLVMRDGRILKGKVHEWQTDSLSFDTTAGRANYNAGDIARLYMSGPPARRLFASATPAPAPGAGGPWRGRGRGRGWGQGNPQASVRVEANRAWTDTGLVVQAGEHLSFSTSGTVTFGLNMTAGADGNKDMPSNPNYPVRNMSVGGLVGRIDNGRPFPIGSTQAPIDMPNRGRLFLGVNDDQLQDNSDAFEVQIFRR